MDCNLIKDKLLEYIDGILNKEDGNIVEKHLKECDECIKEYKEIKESIDYIAENKNKINTHKKIELKPYKKRRQIKRIRRTVLIAIAISLMLMVTAYGRDIFDFMKWWQKSSEIRTTAWEELIDNGVGHILDVSVVNHGIKITAESVIADEINTVILLRIEDLENNIRYTPSFYNYEEDEISPIKIEGDIEKHIKSQEYVLDFVELYAKEENIMRLMVRTKAMTKDVGNIKINIRKLMDKINKDNESMKVKEGNWELDITANKIESREVELDEVIYLDGYEVRVKKITLAPTETNIEYEFQTFNMENKYFLNSLSFLIEYDGKLYGESKIGPSPMAYTSKFGISRGTDSLESLYLEDPSEIKLIVEQYRYGNSRYIVPGGKGYNIDFNNLPQVIEYDNSKIIIEDIIYNQDSVEIIIKEDDSQDRKYIRTDINIVYDIEKGEDIGIRAFFSSFMEYELRDENGKVEDLKDIGRTKKMYDYVIRQKIEIPRSNNIEFGITDDILEQGTLNILGQRFIGYPDKEITIKLK